MQFRVASYNIRKCIGLDRRRDAGRTIDVLNRLDADVIALQEADKRLGARPSALPQRMIEEHTDFEPVDLGDAGSLGSHGNAVLLRKGVEVSHTESLDLPGLEPRGAVIVETVGEKGAMRLVGLHLGLMRHSRKRQLSALRDHIDNATPMPTVIAGDFNEWSKRRGFEALDGYDIHAPGLSYHANRPMAALDRIAHGAGVELRDAGVEQGKLARRASDHLPIWVDLEMIN